MGDTAFFIAYVDDPLNTSVSVGLSLFPIFTLILHLLLFGIQSVESTILAVDLYNVGPL